MSKQSTPEEIAQTYEAIGRFIVEYSGLESDLIFVLGAELRLRADLFDPVLTHDFALLCTAVLTVFEKNISNKDRYKQLTKLIKKCRAINQLRVQVVHGEWIREKMAVLSVTSHARICTEIDSFG